MPRNKNIGIYIILVLAAIGVLSVIARNPTGILVPLLIFGLVFYFYKFPPGRSRSSGGVFKHSAKQKDRKRRKAVFRVINGSKKDQDEDPPRYH